MGVVVIELGERSRKRRETGPTTKAGGNFCYGLVQRCQVCRLNNNTELSRFAPSDRRHVVHPGPTRLYRSGKPSSGDNMGVDGFVCARGGEGPISKAILSRTSSTTKGP